MPAHALRAVLNLYVALAAGAFLAALALNGLAYGLVLSPGLRQLDVDARRRALTRWVGAVVGIQVLVGLAIVVYLVLPAPSPTSGLGRALPPLGAVLGNGLGLQLGVFRLARALRT
ncbi:MAG: hypothetical protein J2P45_32550 [Candidatus Dormibacteraeota bacterium]|nr:hypothetical protein [Candidatus Dormibacteraeota bacterium]